jgi:hypothetical protein
MENVSLAADAAMRSHRLDNLVIVVAWAVILAATCLIVDGVLEGLLGMPSGPLVPAINVVIDLLFLFGVAALWRSGALRRDRLSIAGLAIALPGLAVVAIGHPATFLNPDAGAFFFGIGLILTSIGMIVTGVAVLKARRWDGWRRFTPMACGLCILVVLMPSFLLPARTFEYGVAVWAFCWLLFGLSLRADVIKSGQ